MKAPVGLAVAAVFLSPIGCRGGGGSGSASAPGPGVAKQREVGAAARAAGLWEPLVEEGRRFVLPAVGDEAGGASVVVEIHRVRRVGGARVAELRWLRERDGEQQPYRPMEPLPVLVAVTEAGLYLLDPERSDDHAILAALAGDPTFGDPPGAPPAPEDRDDYSVGVSFHPAAPGRGDYACLDLLPPPEQDECPDTCFGTLCFSAHDGIVRVEGRYSPDDGYYAAPGYEPFD